MGRRRRLVKMVHEHQSFAARFWHPLKGQTVRIALGGDPGDAKTALDKLNEILQNDDLWDVPPSGTPDCVLVAWGGGKPRTVIAPDATPQIMLPASHPDAAPIDAPALPAAEVQRIVDEDSSYDESDEADRAEVVVSPEELRLRQKLRERDAEIRRLREIIKNRDGRYPRRGPAPTLAKAKDDFLEAHKNWDKDYAIMVRLDLSRFVAHFDERTSIDEMQEREQDIEAWLRSLTVNHMKKDPATGKLVPTERHGKPISGGRRNSIRRHVLRFLAANGVILDRAKVHRADSEKPKMIRLQREQAEAVAAALPPYFADLFRVQVAMGLRPDELITLKAADFTTKDYSRVTLSPHGSLTLKQGPREIQVPEDIRPIFKRRLEENSTVFPNPATGKPWGSAKWYNRKFKRALANAKEAAGIPFALDCRVGRRTCAMLLLESGKPIEHVAAILGNTPDVIRDHYAKILSKDVDPTAATLTGLPNGATARKASPRPKPRKALPPARKGTRKKPATKRE